MQKKPTQSSKKLSGSVDKRNDTAPSEFKSKEEQLLNNVKEYLQCLGYNKTYETLRHERPVPRINKVNNSHPPPDPKLQLLQCYDRGQRQEFFKLAGKMFSIDLTTKKLEFEVNMYFCLYAISVRKLGCIDKASSEAFRKYLDSRGAQLANTPQFVTFFALPYVQKPQDSLAFVDVLNKEWNAAIRSRVQELAGVSAKPQTTVRKVSVLQDMYHNYLNDRSEDCKQNCRHTLENDQLREQIHELNKYVKSLHVKFQEIKESSQANLLESNNKWFSFAKELLVLIKRAERGEKIRLDKYERFFGGNLDDLIQANEISIFDKNSYAEEHSVLPDFSKSKQIKKVTNPAACQIDLPKIRNLFLENNRSIEICIVLRALKDRLVKLRTGIERREVVIQYARHDICGVLEERIQENLLNGQSKEFYLRLMSCMTNEDYGTHYLIKSKPLMNRVVSLFSIETDNSSERNSILSILQRFSYVKVARLHMIEQGIIPQIFNLVQNYYFDDSQIQYLIALLMNLSLARQSAPYFQQHKTQLIDLLIALLENKNPNIKNYVNGTLYLVLPSKSIVEEAKKQNLISIIERITKQISPEDECSQQYLYILKRLRGEDQPVDDGESEQEQEWGGENEEEDANEEEEQAELQYIEGEENYLCGNQLLMKDYALLGPQAVKDHMLTRSVLDDTSRRLINMTTSMNKQRKMDIIFSKPSATTYEPELGTLLNRNK